MSQPDPELPKGVKLRDFDDFAAHRTALFDGMKEQMTKAFPQSYAGVRMELHDVDYVDPEQYSIAEQKKALLTDRFLSRRLRGTIKLFDDKTNEELDAQNMTLMRVPYLTDRGTFIHGGNEYTSMMQSRLLPGAYTRRQSSGGLETQFNVKTGSGSAFRVGFEPESSQYRLRVQAANLHLYSLLRDIGVPDEQLEKVWGKEILEANQKKYDARVFEKAYARFVPKREQVPTADRADKVKQIHAAFEAARIHKDVVQRNLPNMLDMRKAAAWAGQQAHQIIKEQLEKRALAQLPFEPDLAPEEIAGFFKAGSFTPDLEPEDLRDEYNRIYGKTGPQLANMKRWPQRWFPPGSNQLGWIDWYFQYHRGERTDDDERQKNRWKQFKARHGAQFTAKPTPRRAFALRAWGVDPLKMLPEAERESFQQKMEQYRDELDTKHELSKSAAAIPVVEHPWGIYMMTKLARYGAGVLFKQPNGKYLLEENMDDGKIDQGLIGKLRPAGGGKSSQDANLRQTILREMHEEFDIDPEEAKDKIRLLGYITQGKFRGCALFEMTDHGLKPGIYQASNHEEEKIKLVESDLDDPRYIGVQPEDLTRLSKEAGRRLSRLRQRRDPDTFQRALDASDAPEDVRFYVSHTEDKCMPNMGDWHGEEEAQICRKLAEDHFKHVEMGDECGKPEWTQEIYRKGETSKRASARPAVVTDRSQLPFRESAEALLLDGDNLIGQLADGADGRKFIKFPGGGIDEGEDIQTGLLRELMEEAGAEPEDLEPHAHSQIVWPPEMATAKPDKYEKWQGSRRHVFSGRLKSQVAPTSKEGDALTGTMRIPIQEALAHIQAQIDKPEEDAGGSMLEHRKLQLAAIQRLMGQDKSAKLRYEKRKVKMVEELTIHCPHCDEEIPERGGVICVNQDDMKHGAPAIMEHRKCGGRYLHPEAETDDIVGWLADSIKLQRAKWKDYLAENPERAKDYELEKEASLANDPPETHHHWRTTYEQCGHTSTCRCSAPKEKRTIEGLCPSCTWKQEKSASDVVARLRQAKELSDQKRYAEKAAIIAALLRDHSDDFVMDEDADMAGITHVPSGFEIHAPRNIVPATVATSNLTKSYQRPKDAAMDKEARKSDYWIGVDLDKTLAFYPPTSHGIAFIGKPIPAMKKRVLAWINSGQKVKIFTARAHNAKNIPDIEAWLERNGFPKLEITNVKDPKCIAIYDDRAHHVPANSGAPTTEHT